MTMTALDVGDVIRAVNRGETTVAIAWNNRPYKLEPGKDQFIPFEAACLWFGDPRSTNSIQSVRNDQGIVAFVPDRESEVRRLRVKYGNIGGDERFVQEKPTIELYDLEGNQIVTPLEDPLGETVNVATPTVADNNDLLELVARQQRQINLLLQERGLQLDDDEKPEDEFSEETDEVSSTGTPPTDE